MPEKAESSHVPIALALIIAGATTIYLAGETRSICLFLPGLFVFCAGAAALT